MLGINCLVNRWPLKEELSDLVEEAILDLESENMAPTVDAVYKRLRQNQYELDSQTVGELYRDVVAGMRTSDSRYSNDDDIDAFSNKAYADLLKAEADAIKEDLIGKNSPVVAVVTSLMKGVKLMSGRVPSVQKVFQERLAKAAKRALNYKPEKTGGGPKTAEEILREVFELERNIPFMPGFSEMENARVLWAEFKKEFAEVAKMLRDKGDVYNADKLMEYAEILEKSTYKLLMSRPEVQTVINETLREAGFKKTVTSSNGTKREIVDWNKVINTNTLDFRAEIRKLFRSKGFTDAEVDRIADEMGDEYDKMLQAKINSAVNTKNRQVTRQQKSAIQRLSNLYSLGIFSNSNQQAIFKVLGVKQASVATVNKLANLMSLQAKALQTPISAWSHTYMKMIQREIEIIIEQEEESQSGSLRAIRAFSMYNQIANSMILGNAQNTVENTLSGLFQYAITAISTSPRSFIKSISIAMKVWRDVARGGTREGNELANSFNTSANAEDRYNLETAKTPWQKIVAGFGLMSRVMLSSMDNAIKAGLIHHIGIDVLKKELQRQGVDRDEANIIINEVFWGNKQEISDMADTLAQSLISAGLPASSVKKKRIEAELAWANMASDGMYFKTLIDDLKAAGKIRKSVDVDIDSVFLNQIYKAAEVAASKGLGHQADSSILKIFTDKIPVGIGQDVQEARRQRVGLEEAEFNRAVFSQLNKFRFGALRWTWLTFEKASGLALVTTLITDVLFKNVGRTPGLQTRKYRQINADLISNGNQSEKDLLNIRQAQLDWYVSLRQRLIREISGPIVGYFTLIALEAILAGGDEDEAKQTIKDYARLLQEDRMVKRWAQKVLPARAYNTLTSIAWLERGKVVVADDFELPSQLSPIEVAIGFNEIAETALNNFNDAPLSKVWDALGNMRSKDQNKVNQAHAVMAESFISTFFTSPLKVFDVQLGPFKHNPILNNTDYNKLKADDWKEGFWKGLLSKRLWESYKGVDKEEEAPRERRF